MNRKTKIYALLVLFAVLSFSACADKKDVMNDATELNNERIQKALDELNGKYGPKTTISFDRNAEQTEEFRDMIDQMSDNELYAYLESLYIDPLAGIDSQNINETKKQKDEPVDKITVEDGVTKILFPSGMDEVYDYNAAILERNPFYVSMVLPEGWSVSNVEPGDEKHIHFGLYSIYQIYDENRVKIGSVGYNIIPDDAQGETLTPMYIYNQIAIGNNYHFEIRDDYTVVKSTERTETAITRVYLSPQINGSDEESWNVGIVSYNLDEGVYIAIELEEAYAEEANAIAQNLSIF